MSSPFLHFTIRNSGSSTRQATIPLTWKNGDFALVSVDWGDGTIDTNLSHNIPATTTLEVNVYVSGYTQNISLGNDAQGDTGGNTIYWDSTPGYPKTISPVSIISWTDGVNYIENFKYGLYGADQLESVPTDISSCVLDMSRMFQYSSYAGADISNWDTSKVQQMQSMFANTSNFNGDIGNWDVSQVLNMMEVFSIAASFNKDLSWNSIACLYMGSMFQDATAFNGDLSNLNTSSVQNMSSMFQNATAFTGTGLENWNTSSCTNMDSMFQDATAFDGDLSNFNTSACTNMYYMFSGASVFTGTGLENWDTSLVEDMADMFYGATAFNADISGWNFSIVSIFDDGNGFLTQAPSFSPITNRTNLNNLLNSLYTQSQTTGLQPNQQLNAPDSYYDTTALAAYTALTSEPINWVISAQYYELPLPYHYPCFLEGTNILCSVDGTETEMPIEQIRRGTLVKTLKNGYVPVEIIGKKILHNPGNDIRIKDRLYQCSPNKYPELKQDLFITGCHSILVDEITDEERELTKKLIHRIFITDKKYRLMACVDKRADPYTKEGDFTIWHLALENPDYFMNYGIYANGLLVESSSRRYMKECSKMEFL